MGRFSVYVRESLQRSNKWLPRWRQPRLDAPVVACCVYRARNAAFVERLIAQLPPGTDVRLHALDGVVAALAAPTVAQGPGYRMPLLAALLDSAPIPHDAWVLIFDDDAHFARRGRTRFLDVVRSAGFDIAQPAIDPGEPHSFSMTLTRLASVARRTHYVEVGPVVAFSPRARAAVLPFPAWARMGWGVDVEWVGHARRDGLSLGVVDATPIRHRGPVAAGYETGPEQQLYDAAIAGLGVTSLHDLVQWIRPRWPLWRRRPPWEASDRAASSPAT